MRKIKAIIFLFNTLIFISVFTNAQTIKLTTEHYPPYNIDLSPAEVSSKKKISGSSTEIVRELMARSGYKYNMELLPWKRAYRQALEERLTGVFSTTRTEAREKLFKWVGPIAENNYVVMTSEKSRIVINSLDDMRRYKVGVYGGSAAASILEKENIPVEIVPKDHLNALKIDRERIDLWFTGRLQGLYLAKNNGVKGLKEIYKTPSRYMYIAFHLGTNDTVIDKLNKILKEMEDDGFIESVYDKYK
jgi:polar amino acid transport system substrate-binding protein